MFSEKIYINRRNSLRQKGLKGIALILGNQESPMNYPANTYPFRQDSNFVYFFGLDLPQLAGIVDFDNGEDIIFGDDVDIDDIIWMGPQHTMVELAAKSGVKKVFPCRELRNYISQPIW